MSPLYIRQRTVGHCCSDAALDILVKGGVNEWVGGGEAVYTHTGLTRPASLYMPWKAVIWSWIVLLIGLDRFLVSLALVCLDRFLVSLALVCLDRFLVSLALVCLERFLVFGLGVFG